MFLLKLLELFAQVGKVQSNRRSNSLKCKLGLDFPHAHFQAWDFIASVGSEDLYREYLGATCDLPVTNPPRLSQSILRL